MTVIQKNDRHPKGGPVVGSCWQHGQLLWGRGATPAPALVVVQLGLEQAPRLVVPALPVFWFNEAMASLVSSVLGLDGQLDIAGLAIHVHHHSGHFVAFLQHVAGVFHAVAADFERRR